MSFSPIWPPCFLPFSFFLVCGRRGRPPRKRACPRRPKRPEQNGRATTSQEEEEEEEERTTSFIFTLYFLYVLIVSGVFIIAFFFSKLVVFGGKRNCRTFDSSSYCLCQNSLELCLCRRRPLSGPKCSSRLHSIDYGRTTIKCTRGRGPAASSFGTAPRRAGLHPPRSAACVASVWRGDSAVQVGQCTNCIQQSNPTVLCVAVVIHMLRQKSALANQKFGCFIPRKDVPPPTSQKPLLLHTG